MSNILFHGSKIGGIKVFEPKPHFINKEKPIVFATHDRNYALAMIHGTGDELAVSYAINPETGKREMYIDELQEGALNILEQVGYIYEVNAEHFSQSPEGLEGEYVSYSPVPTLSETKVANIADALKHQEMVHMVKYEDVPKSMKERKKDIYKPEIKHATERFQDDIVIKKSRIGQFPNGRGVFANRNFKKGEIVLQYRLKPLTQAEWESLPEEEKEFTHTHWGQIYLYPEPERYVNHSANPNTFQNLEKKQDIALRDIKKGEEITTDATKDEV